MFGRFPLLTGDGRLPNGKVTTKMSIGDFFKKIGQWFKDMFTSDEAKARLAQVQSILPAVLQVVKTIAAMTPTRVDDEIIIAFEFFGVPLLAPTVPVEDKLRKLAQDVVTKTLPNVPLNVLNLAIELAVVSIKSSKK
jgi:hypothetical protein